MNESEFEARVDDMLRRIEAGLDRCVADLDFARTGASVLTIEFSDGRQIVVNRHAATRELWLAAPAGGFHFAWDGANWRDRRDGREFISVLAPLICAQLGEPVDFS